MQVIVVYDGPICLKAKQTMKFQNVINIYMMISNISIRPWIQHQSIDFFTHLDPAVTSV